MSGKIKLFAGTGSLALAEEVSRKLGVPLSGRDVIRFPNENIFVRLHESVRGQDCFVIQTTSSPVQENLMELLIMIDCLKRDSADRITAVIPYLAYARSDKKDQPRVPITGRLVADMIQVEIGENVRGLDSFIVQSTSPDANTNLMELLIMADALKRSTRARPGGTPRYLATDCARSRFELP